MQRSLYLNSLSTKKVFPFLFSLKLLTRNNNKLWKTKETQDESCWLLTALLRSFFFGNFFQTFSCLLAKKRNRESSRTQGLTRKTNRKAVLNSHILKAVLILEVKNSIVLGHEIILLIDHFQIVYLASEHWVQGRQEVTLSWSKFTSESFQMEPRSYANKCRSDF